MVASDNSPRPLFPVIGIASFTLVLYSLGLTYSPPHLHEAEVLFGLHAHAIATTGHDLYGRFMPLYFQMRPLGENTWWQPVLVYFTSLFLLILPLTEWALRFPSVVVGTINSVLMFFIARRLFPRQPWAAPLAALLLTLTPSHFMQSRIAMDYIYPVPFALGWLLALLNYLIHPRAALLFASTTLLGLGIYSYLASVIMMPLYFLATLIVLAIVVGRERRHWLAAVAGFAWPVVFVPIWLWFYPEILGQTLGRYQAFVTEPFADSAAGLSIRGVLEELRKPEHFTSLPARLSLYWYFFDPVFLFVYGGYASVVNSTRHVGVFLLPFFVLVPLGLWHFARMGTIANWLAVFLFFSAPLAALTVPEPYAVDREMVLIPAGVLLAVAGVVHLQTHNSRWARRLLAVLLILVPLHFGAFLFDYFVDYRRHAGFWYGLNKAGALEAVIEAEHQQPAPAIYLSTVRDPFLDAYWQFTTAKTGRSDLRSKTIAVDGATLDYASVPRGALLLLNRSDDTWEAVLARQDVVRVADVNEVAEPQQYWVIRTR
jgi:hypothetical protein